MKRYSLHLVWNIFFFVCFIVITFSYNFGLGKNYFEEWSNFLVFTPEILLLYVFIFLFIYSFFFKISWNDCVLIYLSTVIAIIYLTNMVIKSEISWNNDFFFVSEQVLNIKISILVLVLIILLSMYFLGYEQVELALNFELFVIFILCIFGIFIFVMSNHMFILYLGIELQSLAMYISCALNKTSNKSLESALKYFFYGSYASAVLLLGIALIYGLLGTLNFNDIHIIFSSMDNINMLLSFSLFCIIAGFFFKMAVFPFHWWLPEIFEGTADVITFFLAIVPKLSYFYVFSRLFYLVLSKNLLMLYVLIFCGLGSIIIGSILALYEYRFKKLLAYSSIVHMGYMVLALSTGLKAGLVASFYYFFIYIVINLSIFIIFLTLRLSVGSNTLGNITDLVFLKNSYKWLCFFMAVALFSLAGIPPLIGFYGKLFVFSLYVAQGDYLICLIILLTSVLSCAYYIRLLRYIYFDERNTIVFFKVPNWWILFFIVLLFFFNISFLFIQEPLLIHLFVLFF